MRQTVSRTSGLPHERSAWVFARPQNVVLFTQLDQVTSYLIKLIGFIIKLDLLNPSHLEHVKSLICNPASHHPAGQLAGLSMLHRNSSRLSCTK